MKLSFIKFSSFILDGIDPLIVLFKIRENIGCSEVTSEFFVSVQMWY